MYSVNSVYRTPLLPDSGKNILFPEKVDSGTAIKFAKTVAEKKPKNIYYMFGR